MLGDTKNQHYVPKFYLRKFSYQQNDKEIGLFNLNNERFIKRAPLKNQASKDFYYGKDGRREKWLSNLEGKLANSINKWLLITDYDEDDIIHLLTFIVLTSHRNPVVIEHGKGLSKTMDEITKEISPDIEYEKVPDLGHEFAVETSLENIKDSIAYCLDLGCKILLNTTNIPFIVGDNPVVKYNQYLESKRWQYGKTGWGCIGLQVFVPLSPAISVMFYDKSFYKVGKGKNQMFKITDAKDVTQLNLLQMLNCTSTCYFNQQMSESYMRNLLAKALTFNKANQPVHNIFKGLGDDKNPHEIVRFGKTDCEINLNMSWIKSTARALDFTIGDRLVYLRPYVSALRDQIKGANNSATEKPSYTIRRK